MPVLHRNSIFFMGMGERDDYLVTRVIDDKFIALDRRNNLTTWSTLTGKVLFETNIQEAEHADTDFSGFDIFTYKKQEQVVFNREWFSKVLLMSKKPVAEEIDEMKFFHPDDIKTSIKNQQSFTSYNQKEFREFRLVEIQDETEVREIASFIYPYWKSGGKFYMYFSENGEFMFERLSYSRFHIYRRIPLNDDPNRPSRCRWDLVKRITNIPSEFY